MENNVKEAYDMVVGVITTYGLSVIGAIAILIIGWMVAGWAKATSEKAFSRFEKVDSMLAGFFSSLIRYTILVFVVIAVLDQFGVETTSLVAVFGAAGLAIGLALQGTLSNVAAGVMLLLFRPFKAGDYIDAGGVAGTVKSVTLFTTEFATPDNVKIISPNSQIWGSSIKNFSANPTRRVDFVFGIGYGDDIDKAMDIIKALAAADERVHADPAPMVVVGELADSSVNLITRVWCNAGDYWGVKFDLTKAVKQTFDKDGVTIPFPQRDVHLHNAAE
ncbi:MAG: mechanosensitive ion channel [Hyphomicrobiales bacterium]|nr:mechanosensitive ion channel [Hyphomicrobiales bacterium]MCP5370206.1 mechanosensitive ion channel [Hyphomicrobiales bacterium]